MDVTFIPIEYHVLFDVNVGNGVTIRGTMYQRKSPEIWPLVINDQELPLMRQGWPLLEGEFHKWLMDEYDAWQMHAPYLERSDG